MADWCSAVSCPADQAALQEFAGRQAARQAAPQGLGAAPGVPASTLQPAAPTQGPSASRPLAQPAPAEQKECCICMDAEPVSVGVTCGHVGMCADCACAYLKTHTECPACAMPLEALFVPGKGLLKPNKWAQAPRVSAWGQPQRA
ncbi:hypothetical protein ABPG77_010647 [Micractinium sp. CCAP 211/92]